MRRAEDQHCVGFLVRSSALQADETGSIPVRSTGLLVLMVSMKDCQSLGRGSSPLQTANDVLTYPAKAYGL